jgi:hypothetical protein
MKDLLFDFLHVSDGTLFIGSVEDMVVAGQVLKYVSDSHDSIFCYCISNISFFRSLCREPWVGVCHQVPHHEIPNFPDGERLVKNKVFQQSLVHCLGLFTLSTHNKNFLQKHLQVPINVIMYPTPSVSSSQLFQLDSKRPPALLFIGEYLRRFRDFFLLNSKGYRKLLLAPSDVNLEEHLQGLSKEVCFLTSRFLLRAHPTPFSPHSFL